LLIVLVPEIHSFGGPVGRGTRIMQGKRPQVDRRRGSKRGSAIRTSAKLAQIPAIGVWVPPGPVYYVLVLGKGEQTVKGGQRKLTGSEGVYLLRGNNFTRFL